MVTTVNESSPLMAERTGIWRRASSQQNTIPKQSTHLQGSPSPLSPPPPPPSHPTSTSPTTNPKDPSHPTPQVIAHRGYRALYPENTLLAFSRALLAGATGLETDLHLSKDGVVVLSHDANLQRCFGLDQLIKNCEWSYLSRLRTAQQQHQQQQQQQQPLSKEAGKGVVGEPMCSLARLLEFLDEEDNGGVSLFLDIKTDDDLGEMMRRIKGTLEDSLGGLAAWEKRITLICWSPPQIDLAHSILPTFSIAFSSFLLGLARTVKAKYPPTVVQSFSLGYWALVNPRGTRFLKQLDRDMYVWTVNHPQDMQWCIKQGVFRGIMTDDPKTLAEVCQRHARGEVADESLRARIKTLPRFTMVTVAGWVLMVLLGLTEIVGRKIMMPLLRRIILLLA